MSNPEMRNSGSDEPENRIKNAISLNAEKAREFFAQKRMAETAQQSETQETKEQTEDNLLEARRTAAINFLEGYGGSETNRQELSEKENKKLNEVLESLHKSGEDIKPAENIIGKIISERVETIEDSLRSGHLIKWADADHRIVEYISKLAPDESEGEKNKSVFLKDKRIAIFEDYLKTAEKTESGDDSDGARELRNQIEKLKNTNEEADIDIRKARIFSETSDNSNPSHITEEQVKNLLKRREPSPDVGQESPEHKPDPLRDATFFDSNPFEAKSFDTEQVREAEKAEREKIIREALQSQTLDAFPQRTEKSFQADTENIEKIKEEQVKNAKEKLSKEFSPLFQAEPSKYEIAQISTENAQGQEGAEFGAETEKIKTEQAKKTELEHKLLGKKTAELYEQATDEEFKPKVRESAIESATAQGFKVMKVSEFLTDKRIAETQAKVREKEHKDAVNERWNTLSDKEKAQFGNPEEYKKSLDKKRVDLVNKGIYISEDNFYGLVSLKSVNIDGIKKTWTGGVKIPGLDKEKLSKKEFEDMMQNSQKEWKDYIEGTAKEKLNAIVEKGKARMTSFKQKAAKGIIGELISSYSEPEKEIQTPVEKTEKPVEVEKPAVEVAEQPEFNARQITKLIKKAESGAKKASDEIKKMKELQKELEKKGKLSRRSHIWLSKAQEKYF